MAVFEHIINSKRLVIIAYYISSRYVNNAVNLVIISSNRQIEFSVVKLVYDIKTLLIDSNSSYYCRKIEY